MGLVQNAHQRTFLSIAATGKIAQKLREEEPGCDVTKLDDGRVIYRRLYNALEGMITGMYFKDHPEYGRSLNVLIDHQYALQIKCGSRFYYSFCYALPNVDFSRSVTLTPWAKKEGEKTKQALYINQGGDKSVQWHFTRENPDGMPEMVKVTIKNKDMWDDTARQRFFEQYITDKIIPKIKAIPAPSVNAGLPETVDAANDIPDDLPF